MKTRLISLLLSGVLLASLGACAKDDSGAERDETTEALTTETTTTQEETTESTASLAFNEDLLSDIGLTYPQLVEKRGERKWMSQVLAEAWVTTLKMVMVLIYGDLKIWIMEES